MVRTKEERHEYYLSQKEKFNRKSRENYLRHREEVLLRHKQYREKNKDKLNKKRREYFQTHKNESLKKCKEYRDNHKEEIKIVYQQKHQKLRLLCIVHYGDDPPKCACCGESNIKFLTIDHINNDGAEHRNEIGRSKLYSWLIKNNFPEGFQVLCMNCNWGKAQNKGVCPHGENKI